MEFSIPLPQQLDKDSVLSQKWTRFYQRFQYHQNTMSTDDPRSDNISLLLYSAYQQIDSICALVKMYDIDLPKLQKVLEVVEQICLPNFILLFERFQFFTLEQDPSETVNDTAMRLSKQAEICEFGSLKESIMTTTLVNCVQDKKFHDQSENVRSAEFNQIMEMWFGTDHSNKDSSANESGLGSSQSRMPMDLSQIKWPPAGLEQRKRQLDSIGREGPASGSSNTEVNIMERRRLAVPTIFGNRLLEPLTKRSQPAREKLTSGTKMQHKKRKRNLVKVSRKESATGGTSAKRETNDSEDQKVERDKTVDSRRTPAIRPKKSKNLECFLCGKAFAGSKWMHNHFLAYHPACETFSCQHCDGGWSDLNEYVKHYSTHFPNLQPKKSRRRRAKKPGTGKMYLCFLCDRKFTKDKLLKQHMDSLHPECQEYMCTHCGKGYTDFLLYMRHIKRVHSAPEKILKCDLCQTTFLQKRKLGRHLRKHLDLRPHQCELCGKAYNERQLLLAHMRAHTATRNHECKVCGKTFLAVSLLNKHMRSHTGEKPYTCELCGKSYGDKSAFQYHQLCHTGEQPYACEICGKRTRSVGEKNKHKRVHSEKRPYVCEYCGKGFRFISNLIEHRKGHSGKRSHVCDVCGQTFIYRNGLTRHVQLRCPGRRDTGKPGNSSKQQQQQQQQQHLQRAMPPHPLVNPQPRPEPPMMPPGVPPPPPQDEFLPWHSIITNYGMEGNSSVVLVPQF